MIMSTKKVTAFYIEGCPYCRQAKEALKELSSGNAEYSSVPFEWIEENQHPEISEKYDYYFVPSMFVDGKKIYESHRGESKEECFANVKKVFESAIN